MACHSFGLLENTKRESYLLLVDVITSVLQMIFIVYDKQRLSVQTGSCQKRYIVFPIW